MDDIKRCTGLASPLMPPVLSASTTPTLDTMSVFAISNQINQLAFEAEDRLSSNRQFDFCIVLTGSLQRALPSDLNRACLGIVRPKPAPAGP